MLKELDSLERHDRHRRQEAVAKIPVSCEINVGIVSKETGASSVGN